MKKKFNKGFTMVELIIIIGIIAILAAFLVPQYFSYTEDAREVNDLQIATGLIEATQLAIATSDIPADAIIEILWCTGYAQESGHKNKLLVREASRSGRTSIFIPTVGSYTSQNLDLEELQGKIVSTLGYEASGSGNEWTALVDESESEIASLNNFAFHMNAGTGEVCIAYNSVDGTKNIWVDEIGVDITPAP